MYITLCFISVGTVFELRNITEKENTTCTNANAYFAEIHSICTKKQQHSIHVTHPTNF